MNTNTTKRIKECLLAASLAYGAVLALSFHLLYLSFAYTTNMLVANILFTMLPVVLMFAATFMYIKFRKEIFQLK